MKFIAKRNFSISHIFSALALVISLAALWQTDQFNRVLMESRVVLSLERDHGQRSIVFQEVEDSQFGAIYTQRYKLTVNNIGQRDASIIHWRVVATVSTEPEVEWGWYAGLKPRFVENNMTLHTPFSVEVQKPRAIILEVGTRVPLSAWNIVGHNFEYGTEYNYTQADQIFSSAGVPLFGQAALNRTRQFPEYEVRAYGAGPHLQRFNLYAIKGDGKQICAVFFHVIAGNFLQGENAGTYWENASATANFGCGA